MKRRLFTLATILSLWAMAATIVFWVRSTRRIDEIDFLTRSGDEYGIATSPGEIEFSFESDSTVYFPQLPPELRHKPGFRIASHRVGLRNPTTL